MKYAIEYNRPNSNRIRRTRFLSLSMAKKKKEIHEQFGFETRLVPRSELKEPTKESFPIHRPFWTNISNHWKFLFFDIKNKFGEVTRTDMRCIKNGKVISLSKLP